MKKFIPVMALLMCFVILTSASYAFDFDLDNQTVIENEHLEINLSKEINTSEVYNCSFGIVATDLPTGYNLIKDIFTWTPSYEDSGTYYINFTANCINSSDNASVSNSSKITIIVEDAFTFMFKQDTFSVVEKELLSINLSDGLYLNEKETCSSHSFEVVDTDLPTGYALDNDIFTWTPSYKDSGSYYVNFTASCDGEEVSDSSEITINVLDAFKIEKAEVDIDGYGKDDELDEVDTSFDVYPGDHVELKLEIRNIHTDEYEDLDFKDVYFELIIQDFEDEGHDDLEIESDEDDIRAGYEESFSVSFDVPYRIEEGYYDLEIKIHGEDEEGTYNTYETSYTVEVRKKSDDLLISADIFPQRIYANEPSKINVFGLIENIGKNDIDDLVLKIQSPDTEAFSFIETDIELDSDPYDEDSRYNFDENFEVTIDEPGTYNIIIRAEWDDKDETKEEKFELEVIERPEPEEPEEPEEPAEPEEPEEDDVEIITPPQETEENKTTEIIVRETPFTESAAFIGILTGITGLLVILLILMIIMLLKK